MNEVTGLDFKIGMLFSDEEENHWKECFNYLECKKCPHHLNELCDREYTELAKELYFQKGKLSKEETSRIENCSTSEEVRTVLLGIGKKYYKKE